MAGLAFANGVRLHKDAVLLFKNGSFPSAYFFSILAQEEIGKAFILEEHIFQMGGRSEDITPDLEKLILDSTLSHKVKQGWFSREADDYWKYKGKRLSKFIKETSNGKLEDKKQNSVYVGLTRKGKSVDARGRIINPLDRVKPDEVKSHITRVNDYIVVLIEGCRRNVYSVDTEELDSYLTINLAQELEALWPYSAKATQSRLKQIRKFKIE